MIFVAGGIRSGKSRFALKLAEEMGPRRAFIATAQALDPEMERRIRQHQAARSKSWVTYEEPVALSPVLEKLDGQYDVILVDCLSLWLSNLLHLERSERALSGHIKELIKTLRNLKTPIILISNEVGFGVIPVNPLARRFCDLAGALHQEIARLAREVYLLTSGIATQLK